MIRNISTASAALFILVAASHPVSAQLDLDNELITVLRAAGFTGTVQQTLESRLGRSINKKLANLGRLLWFDTAGGLHSDNTCGGCHSPTNGFGDTQSIAIG